MLKHQAQIGDVRDHNGLIQAAKKLNLPSAQYWLAHNGQYGAGINAADRYPIPQWSPRNGWRIDPALALAHMRQESNFRPDVVSPAGAVGLMQVLPTTANAMANMEALVQRYRPAPKAFLVVPLVGAFFIDFANALLITFFVNLWR